MQLTIIIISITSYFVILYLWLSFTLKYKYSINYYIFRHELDKKTRKTFMHYIEIAIIILVLIGFITTIISQIQIFINYIRRNKNGYK